MIRIRIGIGNQSYCTMMQHMFIKPTLTSPMIELKADGNFLIEGNLFPENALSAFKPVYEWLMHFQPEHIRLVARLNCLNGRSSIQLYNLLKHFEATNKIKSITVHWHYEEDDEDHLETALMYEEQLKRTQFRYFKEAVEMI